MLTLGRTKSVWNLKQGSYQLGEPGEPGIFRGKGYQGEGVFWGNFMEKHNVITEIFFTSVFVLCHSETLREWLIGTTVTLWESQLQCVYVFVF